MRGLICKLFGHNFNGYAKFEKYVQGHFAYWCWGERTHCKRCGCSKGG